jgi:hypothetical protein
MTPASLMPVYALSLRQPWAYAILHLGKDVENRTWPTRFRGRVRIHASRQFDEEGLAWLRDHGYPVTEEVRWTGGYVGEVTITDCRPVEECSSSWAWGPWCFLLQDAVSYDTIIPARGRLGFFRVEGE